MNFYASSEYLQVVADVYFAGKSTRVADVGVGDQVLRVLVVEDREVATDVPFLDYHMPLRADEIGRVERRYASAPRVAHGIITSDEVRTDAHRGPLAAPYVDWLRFASYERYHAWLEARHKSTIKQHSRLRSRLAERFGALEFTVDDTRPDVVDLALQWKSSQFRETGLVDLFSDPRNVRYFEVLRDRGLLVASTLRASGRLLSVWLGFIHDGVWSGWIFAYDHAPELKPYSIGYQLMHSILAHSSASGHREFDFSYGGQDWKWFFATHGRVLRPLDGERRFGAAREIAKTALKRMRLLETARALRKALGGTAKP